MLRISCVVGLPQAQKIPIEGDFYASYAADEDRTASSNY